MPYGTVEALRASTLFKRMSDLQKMSTHALGIFVATFDSVHARVLRHGGSPDEAESTAIPIALSAARRARAAAAGTVERAKHFFVPVKEIRDSKYDLSISRYRESDYEVAQYDPPQEILGRLRSLDNEVRRDMDKLEAMLK